MLNRLKLVKTKVLMKLHEQINELDTNILKLQGQTYFRNLQMSTMFTIVQKYKCQGIEY
jgi:hypothetical protein